MITIRLSRPWLRLELVGHAGYAQHGTPDIVCAAASMLGQTLLRKMQNEQERGACQVVYEARDGYMRIQCQVTLPYYTEQIYSCYEMAEVGFKLLEETYPEHVKFEEG